jgi:membrane protein
MAAWDIPGMLKQAFQDWNEDDAPRLGAALSYYTIFSIAPLLLISIALAGLVFGQEAAQGRIVARGSWPSSSAP